MRAPDFDLVRTAGGAVLKVYRTPQPVSLKCTDCGWTGAKSTRVPAGENQHPCPNGCGHVRETAA